MAYFETTLDHLPELDPAGKQHCDKVASYIDELIEASDGFIGFDRYMQSVLYAPGLGYYSAGAEKFGIAGDYVTAPLISPLFSQTLANFASHYLQADDAILELGAGTGDMAADMLARFAALDISVPHYNILESAADLRQRQSTTLKNRVPEIADRVTWLDNLPASGSFRGVVVGNEVIDAMPVKRFVLQSGEVLELGVGHCDGQLCWKTSTADEALKQAVLSRLSRPLADYPDGYVSEYCPVIEAWFKALFACMDSAVVMLLDYGHERSGYYDVVRKNGTLRAYYRHHMLADPFVFPGLVDLTASVDFTGVAEAAAAAGFEVNGYTSQANFLIDAGILDLAAGQLATERPSDHARLSRAEAIKCLTDPGEMGESIKLIMLSKGRDVMPGLSRDQRYRL